MLEKHLLLPSAKSAVLVGSNGRSHYVRVGAVIIGLLCVIVGGADLTTRLVERLGPGAAFVAFAPAAALGGPLEPTAAAVSAGVIVPARLKIPSLGVNAEVESVGIKEDGTMGTPLDFDHVSWYSPGARPGAEGSAVFAGHVNNALLKPGVFEHLSQVVVGDYITVEDKEGKTLVYRVSSVTEYPANAATDSIFATSGPTQITLITCDGDWVPSKKTFDKRLVVVAKAAY